MLAATGTPDGRDFDNGVLAVLSDIEQTGGFDVDVSLWDSNGLANPARADLFSAGNRYGEIALKAFRRQRTPYLARFHWLQRLAWFRVRREST
jgi:hypothetical protein